MDKFIRKRDAALSFLAATGMWKWNYLPPIYPILWKIGVKVPPPHFQSSLTLALMGIPFGFFWLGFIMLEFQDNFDFETDLIFATLMGAAFGVANALYYYYGRMKHKIPQWSAL